MATCSSVLAGEFHGQRLQSIGSQRVMGWLKFQYFGHQMQKVESLEKTLMLERLKWGGEGDDRGWDGWMASPTQWTWVWIGSGSWWWTGSPGVLQSMGSQRLGHNWATEQQQFHIHIQHHFLINSSCISYHSDCQVLVNLTRFSLLLAIPPSQWIFF